MRAGLAALTPDGIVAFQAFLDQACDRAFTWELVGAATRIFGGWCSDDSFEYFRLWLIGRGRVTFERAITMPDSLATVPAIQRLAGRRRREWNDDEEWPEWETLDYIAASAYRLVTGTDDECGEDFYERRPIPSWAARASGATQTGSAGMPQTSQPRR